MPAASPRATDPGRLIDLMWNPSTVVGRSGVKGGASSGGFGIHPSLSATVTSAHSASGHAPSLVARWIDIGARRVSSTWAASQGRQVSPE